jgi:predicted PurR-regulated permease PerM
MTVHEPMTQEIGRSPDPGPTQVGTTQGRVVVVFHPRSILTALGVLLAVIAAVEFMLLAQAGLTLVVIALFLALALNPAVECVQRRGLGRGSAVGVVYVLALAVLALLGRPRAPSPPARARRWRCGPLWRCARARRYLRSVGGFVTGNLLASLLAGLFATIIMLVAGVPYAVPLGLFVAIIELVPYVGPLVATIVVTAVALTGGPYRRSSRSDSWPSIT